MQLQSGDHVAFRELYAIYHQLLYGVACKYLKDTVLAEDAVHEVFVKLWVNRQQLDPAQGVRNFLFKCLKYHILNLIRDHKRALIKQYNLSYQAPAWHEEPESAVLFNDYKKVMEQAIEQLSPRKKDIFKLRTIEGLSNAQVATRLGISIHTVKLQFSQASQLLKHYLKIFNGTLLLIIIRIFL
ncbi:sigma-70 family RNA polymerase sigma factor [Chitinophaga agrisoli]|uniref:Sigma-70 family RNA polymerase sigma factor n=1 Tax=Chitinophaga agrisoli TaxID=2607653 RepID=A0A5B2VTZ2_9BACT|nr:sigma-70 family RNA polymerase sigma factor [Chitinophaga agrisoli]KAA2241782.1 sigma-70 family RNA polymerase sigma factor [Chitinophaga agrisoli]